MNRLIRIVFLLAMVVVLVASMTAVAAAAKPESPSNPAEKKPGDGGITPTAVQMTVYADTPGWTTTGTWRLENYESWGGAKILVGNIAGDTAYYTFGKSTVVGNYLKVYSAKYWSCGDVIIELGFINQGGQYKRISTSSAIDLTSSTTIWGSLIYTSTQIPNEPSAATYRLTIRATGAGGPVDGDGKPLTYGSGIPLAFVNVQKVEVDTTP